MEDYKKIKLLVQVAKLYYENDYSQEMVAKTLNLSRPYISKLLNEAKAAGIVRVQVIDPLSVETVLEKKIRERFGLKKVIIVPRGTEGNALFRLGLEAARYLDGILRDGDMIGTSWGETIYECSKVLMERQDLKDLVSVQLCGGTSNLNKKVYTAEIAGNFSVALGCSSFLLPLPAVLDNKKMVDMLREDHHMAKILQYGYDANIALVTMGAFGVRSALVRAGYLEYEQMERLLGMGAVGDICSHIIDIHGNICDRELDERTMAVPLDVIRQKEYRIGVAQGVSKVESICGALNGGIVNVLITNEDTAEWVLNRLDRM